MFTLDWLVVEFIRISLRVDVIVASSDVDMVLTRNMKVLVIVFFLSCCILSTDCANDDPWLPACGDVFVV